GVLAEPAGAAAMAGLKQLRDQNIVKADQTAVVMVTGNGLKDIDGVMKAVAEKPLLVEASLDAVSEELR
nr:threonine synthase [Phycisphaerae bacterium]